MSITQVGSHRRRTRYRGRMHQQFVDTAAANLMARILWIVNAAVFFSVVSMIGTLLWGRGDRKLLVHGYKATEVSHAEKKDDNGRTSERLAALEARARASLSLAVNVPPDSASGERESNRWDAVDKATTCNLKEMIEHFPRPTLVGGHAYVSLPKGTNIVLMVEGTMRQGLLVPISAAFSSSLVGRLSAALRMSNTKANWRASPGAGETAAKLIATPLISRWCARYGTRSTPPTSDGHAVGLLGLRLPLGGCGARPRNMRSCRRASRRTRGYRPDRRNRDGDQEVAGRSMNLQIPVNL